MIEKIIALLRKHYPKADTALIYGNPFQLLVSTILSAQCTDKRVNMVTPGLFRKYPSVKAFAEADLEELMQQIRSTGFYRNKAKNIKNASRMILEDFNEKVPDTMEDLLKLPGVARKTANIVLYHAMGKIEGIAVDTHVRRLSFRLGWTKSKDPKKIEQDLMKIIPKEDWGRITDMLIDHGRALCIAQRPRCSECFLNKICPNAENVKK